jgi:hypothetical protein
VKYIIALGIVAAGLALGSLVGHIVEIPVDMVRSYLHEDDIVGNIVLNVGSKLVGVILFIIFLILILILSLRWFPPDEPE